MQIPVGRFDGSWQYKLSSELDTDFTLDEITVVTFNVWFDRFNRRLRHDVLFEEVHQCDADIIVFQEMTQASLDQLLELQWVQETYCVSDIGANTFESYGVVLLSRLPMTQLSLIELPSLMDRKLVLAEFEINGQKLLVGGVHLERLSQSDAARREQVELIGSLVADVDHSIIMGDCNLCSSWPENEILDSRFSDAWPIIHPSEPGFTEDTSLNTMKFETRRFPSVRFDRVLFRSLAATSHWRPDSIELLGTTAIQTRYPSIFPSDHFGLCAKFVWEALATDEFGE